MPLRPQCDADTILFMKGSSPPPDMEDLPFDEAEIATEIDSDDHVSHGRKRSASAALDNR